MATKYQKMVEEVKVKFINVLEKKGWKEDRWGHMTLQEGEQTFRMRFRPRVIRHEIRTSLGQWKRIGSVKYEDLVITEEMEFSGFRK